MMATQSLLENGMPFTVTATRHKAFGVASKLADPALMAQEKGAFERAMVDKKLARIINDGK